MKLTETEVTKLREWALLSAELEKTDGGHRLVVSSLYTDPPSVEVMVILKNGTLVAEKRLF